MKILIKANYILTMNEKDEVIEDGAVIIENEKITKISKSPILKMKTLIILLTIDLISYFPDL